MGLARFGQLLGRFVPLSEQDVAEVLEAQAVTGRRFGEIALSWGLCRPLHVWQAWAAQLAHRSEPVDLQQIGIDTQALHELPAKVAQEFGVVPIRCFDNQLVLATSAANRPRAQADLAALLGREVQFVLCAPEQLAHFLALYYSTPPTSPDAPCDHSSLAGASTI